MTDNNKTPDNQDKTKVNRRSFMSGTLGAAAGIGAATLMGAAATAQAQPPGGPPGGGGAPASRGPSTFGVESDIHDCEVEGVIPSDLEGAFYRVGPDAQYPLAAGNIPFDGEGHVGMFRFKDGRVDYKTRYVKNERWNAQNEAGRILFPMYRNPSMDDPSVAGLSRSTANTHIINHRNLLLCLKEDSPPSALDLLTLETVDPVYRFDDQLNSKTFTAHPKVDSESGNIVAFGYEAEGHGSRTATAFEITGDGRKVWEASVECPYVGMLHDFAVTQNYIVLYQIPMIMDQAQMDRGGIHWSWDDSMPTYFGYFRRDGDGSDVRWIQGPTRSATHVMGAWDDGDKVYIDVEMSESNPFPFMPMKDDAPWNPAKGTSRIHRLSADLGPRTPRDYSIEKLAEWTGALPRQDDRYNTMPYRYGFMGTRNINAAPGEPANGGYVRFDHATGTQQFWDAGPGTGLAECCFAPKSIRSGEGEGYLMGVASRNSEGGRGDLVILDAMHLEDGPVAVVKLPIRATGQVHGWFVPEWQMPVG